MCHVCTVLCRSAFGCSITQCNILEKHQDFHTVCFLLSTQVVFLSQDEIWVLHTPQTWDALPDAAFSLTTSDSAYGVCVEAIMTPFL